MALIELLKERRSVHVFEDREVPVALVQELLEAAVWVPNHKMTQPWRFVIVHGGGKEKLANAVRNGKGGKFDHDPAKKEQLAAKFLAVPLFLAVVIKENPNPAVREEDYASASCIIHNFSLLAWERSIGLVWETYGLMYQPLFREALGVQPGEKIVGVLHIGYPQKVPMAQPRIPAVDRLTIIE